MKKTLFLVLILGLVRGTVQAAPVSESSARAVAAQFMVHKKLGVIATDSPKMLRGKASAQPALYVFNAQKNLGWVIVSGDDRTRQVLGYSAQGNYDPNDVPENMQAWLDQYVEEIACLDEDGNDDLPILGMLESSEYDVSPKATAVAPFIQTKWNQGTPYYLKCPQINSTYCVTGCTATAMAQVMYYYQWPYSTSQNIPAYTIQNTTYDALPRVAFSWSEMKKTYTSSDTDPSILANAAVAWLMRYCGQAVEMEYGTNSSGAHCYSEVFGEYFKYSTKARKVRRCDYSYAQWENFIVTEVSALRPVIFVGMKHTGGHTFICDGCDGSGYYHFNWGWSGNNDGYFLLTALNPKGGGIGSVPGNNGYAMQQYLIIGLEPNSVSTSELNSLVECSNAAVGQRNYTRSSSSDPFVIDVSSVFYNHSPVSRTYDLGWGVYKADGHTLYKLYTSVSNQSLGRHENYTMVRRLNFGKDYANGLYYLRPICRQSGNSTWRPCHYSGADYIYAYISGNDATLYAINKNNTNGVTASIISYGAVRKVNRPLEVTVRAGNKDLSDYTQFYLFEDDELVGANSLTLDKGNASTVKISYIPKTAGTKTLKITADRDGANIYCTGSVDVAASSAANLSMSYYVSGADASNNRTVIGTSLPFTVTIKNDGTTVYNDFIVAKFYKRINGYIYFVTTKEKGLNLAAGSTVREIFTFDNLEPGDYYAQFFYYNYDKLVQGVYTVDYHVVNAIHGDVNGDGSVNAADVTALYNYILNGDETYLSTSDVNNDNAVNAGDVTAVYNIILGQN